MADTISLAGTSRYKDTVIFRTPDNRVVPGLMEPPSEFDPNQEDERVHIVEESEIGFLDSIAIRYYGPGLESLWWGIALANGLVDVETELYPGDAIVIPPRAQVLAYIARASRDDTVG